jgi:hypothetical protein
MASPGLRRRVEGCSIGATSRDGEGDGLSDDSHDNSDQRASVPQAAQILGITEGAVRKRVERGKLTAERRPDGRLIVYLDSDTTDATHDATHDKPRQSRSDRYTRSLEEQVEYLRGQLDQERQARTEEKRRHDQLMAQLTQANAALAARIPEQLEAPLTVEEGPEEAEATPAAGEAQDDLGAERARRETAETTLREGMAEERRRREEAERERDELRIFGPREARESPPEAEEQQGRGEPHSDAPDTQEAVQRPWWRRMLGS